MSSELTDEKLLEAPLEILVNAMKECKTQFYTRTISDSDNCPIPGTTLVLYRGRLPHAFSEGVRNLCIQLNQF
ncbi:hypothetical protein [Spartinivicinus marinus]|uniref:hypothetical protein n=1 Tax=Spartinivicinus marinus TaxID=2994442 RepID=UPI002258682C|nr:hypothetical protein [Spartinivicinus marinus]MCX4025198.1 hypothetical protein [Spartinivicinus marinus]